MAAANCESASETNRQTRYSRAQTPRANVQRRLDELFYVTVIVVMTMSEQCSCLACEGTMLAFPRVIDPRAV